MQQVNLKRKLKSLLRNIEVSQDELYYRTGYNIDDVKTTDDFNEIVRVFSSWFYGLDKWYVEKKGE